jgi:hypothetical protein
MNARSEDERTSVSADLRADHEKALEKLTALRRKLAMERDRLQAAQSLVSQLREALVQARDQSARLQSCIDLLGGDGAALGQARGEASDLLALPVVARAIEKAQARAAAFRWDPFGNGGGAPRPERPPPPGRPLNVAVGEIRGNRTLFRTVHDPRVRISPVSESGSAAPDVLVLDGINATRAEDSARSVSPELWARIARGEARLVLDGSSEGGRHKASASTMFHDLLRSRGVDPVLAAHVTQDRGYPADYAAWCRANGVERPMSVWIFDRYVQQTFAAFHDGGESAFAIRLKRSGWVKGGRTRRFVCLNKVMRPIRLLFLLRLMQEGLWNHGFISTGPVGPTDRRDLLRMLRSTPGFGPLEAPLSPLLDELAGREPISLGVDVSAGDAVQRRAMIDASELKEYTRSWFTIVTETDFDDRPCRITEKPLKPLLNFHPFILLGSPGSLRFLKAYGFDTYPEVFDERYDDELDRRTRFDMAFNQVARLCRMDEAALARLGGAATQTAVFNAWWGMVELPRLFRSHIDAALIDQLEAMFGAEAASATR